MELLKQKICFVVYFIQSQSHNAAAIQYHNFMTCMRKFVYPSYYSELDGMFPKLAWKKSTKALRKVILNAFKVSLEKLFFRHFIKK